MPLITLLTDFGTRDTYVGVMKGVIKCLAPEAQIVDLTHHVPPQDIPAGAFALLNAYSFFPPGTIHVVVVDPGVGGTRHPIAAHIGEHFYVGPDNGLLTPILARETLHQAVILDHPQFHRLPVSGTFHGRDIFAPAAAHLANGLVLSRMGTSLETLTQVTLAQPDMTPDMITCHVVHIDVFGNAITDLTESVFRDWATSPITISVNGRILASPAGSYGAVPTGCPLTLFGGGGFLEIAVRDGSAAQFLSLSPGAIIRLSKITISQ